MKDWQSGTKGAVFGMLRFLRLEYPGWGETKPCS